MRLDAFLRRAGNSWILLLGLVLLFSGPAHAQGGVPLVTVATDQSSLSLSDQFGVPAGTAINQAGDFAFVGNGDTALFLRAAGASSATRLLQIDDQVPGFAGSQIMSFLPELSINSSRSLLFGVRFTDANNLFDAALLIYDGTNYHTVVSSDDFVPGSTTSTYGSELFPGGIDDSGDVDFAAAPTGINATTFYIVPSGGTAVRIAGLNDTPPSACTWCVPSSGSLGGFFTGVPVTSVFLGVPFIPGLNAKGQVLLQLWGGLFIGGKDGSFTLVPMAGTGACSPQPSGTIPLPAVSGFLNDNGVVAYTNPSSTGSAAICVAPAGGGVPVPAVSAADPAPASLGGTITSPVAIGLDNSGDIILQSPISGGNLTTFALLRYHQSSGQSDVVAYNCEAAPGTNGSLFSFLPASTTCGASITFSPLGPAFRGVSIANDGSVSFNASLSIGGNAIYRQTGAAAPAFISLAFNGSPLLPFSTGIGLTSVAFFSTNGQTKILNNDSVFFATYLTSGAADFAVYLGTPGNVQTLMSTADLLPAGARTILGSNPPQAAGHFVAFTAQPAAGRTNILESDLTTGAITRVVSDNDPALATAGGPSGNRVLAPNYFLNQNGQIALETVSTSTGSELGVILFGSGAVNSAWLSLPTTCGTIYLWSPSGGLTKVVAPGDAAPNQSETFSCVTLNEAAPSPLNQAGEVVFSSPSPYGEFIPCTGLCDPGLSQPSPVNGDFLYSASGTISEIAAASDTLPGESVATSLVPTLSIPVNSAGQVAFGAQLGTSTWGFYQRNGNTAQKVIENGDPVPGPGGATFGFPHFIAGQTDSGNVAFTAATSAAIDGLFLAPAGGAIQTLALDGGAAPVPGGGTLSLATALAGLISSGTTTVTTYSFGNFATINGESDVAFPAKITGGTTNSGYFRVLQSGPTAGTLQAVAWQGEAVPGGGTFNVIPVQNNTLINQVQNFALGPDGTLAFVNTFNASSSLKEGMFLARPDGTLVKVAATGDFLPGGGTLAGIAMSSKLAAGDAGKFAFIAGIVGGSARRAVFVTAIPPGTASTTTTLSQLQSPAVAQQPATLTATVTSSTAGNPTGTVAFFANGVSLGTGGLNSSGQATLATSSLAAGQDSIVAQYDGDSNFASGNSSPLAVVVAGFAAPPSNLTVTPGQNLVIPMTVFAPAGSSMSFTLSCSGLPANTTCMFDTNPVTPGPSGTTVHLTFTTMAGSKLPPVQPRNGHPALPGFGLFTLLTALFAAGALVWRRAPRWRLVPCACLATFALALAIGGCGTSSYSSSQPMTPGTPAGPAAFTVTGTSGATTISAVVSVTVR